jgi:hypothetical protein
VAALLPRSMDPPSRNHHPGTPDLLQRPSTPSLVRRSRPSTPGPRTTHPSPALPKCFRFIPFVKSINYVRASLQVFKRFSRSSHVFALSGHPRLALSGHPWRDQTHTQEKAFRPLQHLRSKRPHQMPKFEQARLGRVVNLAAVSRLSNRQGPRARRNDDAREGQGHQALATCRHLSSATARMGTSGAMDR